MKKDYMDACMNSTRQRIMQVIMIKKEATSAEIGEELPDIPRASLYRHIKVLLDAEIIVVVKEESKRGSIEKTYAIATKMPYEDTNQEYNKSDPVGTDGITGGIPSVFQWSESGSQKRFADCGICFAYDER